MKKSIFIAIVAVASLASCKKDRTCTCTSTSTAPGYTGGVQVYTIIKAKKGDAKKNCISHTSTTAGYTYTNTCSLK